MMMNKMPSGKRELAKFLLVFPVLAVLLLACQEDSDSGFKTISEQNAKIHEEELQPGEIPDISFLPPVPEAVFVDPTMKAFLSQNPTIRNFTHEVSGNTISSATLELQSGIKELYNFKLKADVDRFTRNYGALPKITLPPPPPPVITPASAAQLALQKRNPQVKMVGWQGENTMVVFLVSGEREEYDLNQPARKAAAEKKYGKLPEMPVVK